MLLAATGGSSLPGENYLLQLGILGIIFLLNLTGYVWVKPSVQRLFEEIERLRTRNEELEKLYNEQMYPFMQRQAEVLNLALQQIQTLQRELHGQRYEEVRLEGPVPVQKPRQRSQKRPGA